MLETHSETVCFDSAEMDFICFGRGKKALMMYDQWGHGLYEEAPDFWDVVVRFLKAAQ